MPTTVQGMEIATPTSDHIAPGPTPAMTNTPPLPPGPGPVPAPFLYISRSATAGHTLDKLMVGGDPVLVLESDMAVEMPGNVPGKPCEPTVGADLLTRMVNARTAVGKGFGKVKVWTVDVAATTSAVYMNVPNQNGKKTQSLSQLWAGFALRIAASLGAAPGATPKGEVDPVSVATGAVFDEDDDLLVRGETPVVWRRVYTSQRAGERSPLGQCGFTHSFHQWIASEDDRLTLRDADGTEAEMPLPAVGEALFFRPLRLEVRRRAEAVFDVHDVRSRSVRRFEPLAPGGRAVLRGYRSAAGRRIELVYTSGALSRIVTPSGRELRLSYDAEGRITRVELWARGGPWKAVTYAYDDSGDLVRFVGAGGEEQSYSYDGAHRMVKKTLPNGLSFHYAYDPETARCVHAWGDGGLHEARFDYDLTKGTTAVTGNPAARFYAWNERGAVTSVRASDGARFEQAEYDDDQHLLHVADEHGDLLTRELDDRGNPVSEIDGDGRETRREYRDDLEVKRIAPGGLVTEYEYDRHGSLVAVRYPSGATLAFERDEHGRLVRVTGPDGTIGAFEYDAEDNIVTEIGARGDVSRFAYDALGRITRKTDALGRSITFTHDAEDRVATAAHPDGGVERTSFDALGEIVSQIDAEGRERRYVRAGTAAILEHHMPGGEVWKTRHDKRERPCLITNAKGETWEYRRDRAGRTVEERTFDGRTLRYRHGPSDHVRRVDRPDGTWREIATTRQGEPLVDRTPHGTIQYTYDDAGRLLAADLNEAPGPVSVKFAYDAVGRLLEDVQDGLAVRYTYDERGLVASRTLPTGHTTRFAYDASGLLARIEHSGHTLTFTHDAVANEVRRTWAPAGVELVTDFDPMDRPARVRLIGAPDARGARPVLFERATAFDRTGRPTDVTDSLDGPISFSHDPAGRLTTVRRRGGEERYTYDAAGSLVGASHGPKGPEEPWAVAPGNVLLRAGSSDFAHDALRRRTRRALRRGGATEVTEYLWDARDRLREVRLPGGERVVFTYDAFARLLRKDVYAKPSAGMESAAPARTVRYLWQGFSLAAEIDPERGTRVLVHGPGSFLPLLQEQDGEVFAYVCDPVGTPLALFDARGACAWRARATVWGAPLDAASSTQAASKTPASSGVATKSPASASTHAASRTPASPAVDTPFRLLGQVADPDTGLTFTRYRFFDPETARWLAPDPIGLEGGPNPAAWNGSPIMHADPLGLRCAFGNPAIDAAFAAVPGIPPKPGYYDVIIHGAPDKVMLYNARGNETALTPQQLAAWVRGQPDYRPGTPIRLISCATAQSRDAPNGFAKQFGQQMGVHVVAPTNTIRPVTPSSQNPSGLSIDPHPPVPADPARTSTPGKWISFLPGAPSSPIAW